MLVPSYACEMRVWGGTIEVLSAKLPFETEDWDVHYAGGSRSSFLPVDFEADGPIRLSFSLAEVPELIVVGDKFSLVVLEQVEVSKYWPDT